MKITVPPRAPDKGSLWLLTIAPTMWAAHLLLCYITAAVWCARFAAPGDALGGVRTAIAWYTAVALIGIAVVGWEGFRRHSFPSSLREAQGRPEQGRGATALGAGPSTPLRASGTEATTHDLDSPEDRHRFLGFATLLLSGLSAVAVAYAALAATFFDTCR
jgi:hypothetical protein